MRNLLFILVIALFVPSHYAVADEALIQQLSDNPLIAEPMLSEDGHFISAYTRETKEAQLSVWRWEKGFSNREKLPYQRSQVLWTAWVGDGRLLLSLKESGLVLYDAHIKRLKPLIENGGPRPDELRPVLLSAIPDDPTNILMQWEDPKVKGYPAVYRVDAVRGVSTKIISAWAPVIRWWASPEGEVKLGEGFQGNNHILLGPDVAGSWKVISKHDYITGTPPAVLSVETGGATALTLSAHASDKKALWRLDINSGDFIDRLAGHRGYDIASALIHPGADVVFGAVFYAEGREAFVWQKGFKEELQFVANKIGEDNVSFLSSSRDGRVKLFMVDYSHRPPSYVLYKTAKKEAVLLPEHKYSLLPMVQTESAFIPVAKRKLMHTLISSPKGGDKGKAILYLHGGPQSRAVRAFDPQVSLLVAMGFTVVQPNFRGSKGYGEAWRKAGYGEWGGTMQRDISAAIDWVISSGYATSDRLCIMGGSYGGYAAMMALAFDSHKLACGISLNGIASLNDYVENFRGSRFGYLSLSAIVGDSSEKALFQKSPLHKANLIRDPLLLLHGTSDSVVPFLHSQKMARRLLSLRKEVEFVALNDVGHVLNAPQAWSVYLKYLQEFLEDHVRD
ncbi:S9 family peptidase [Kordiimonas sp. SCSIO 12603]|uniref:alpha/beta hydrolase family protein n=1 Tax=Kordiimonas sp. SCSIO 12603 TaxID=2829596 RepID=UPI002105C519|nr:prolyl oligopeptidase family serine peptidase [Kordiimonas sp. SCSIO 12603]UTW58370.1 S9 family peptidase [Kordiimonas sp. SCSIO 12603]